MRVKELTVLFFLSDDEARGSKRCVGDRDRDDCRDSICLVSELLSLLRLNVEAPHSESSRFLLPLELW